MKIKKEYIILFIIIAVLVLYIFLRKENRMQYDIPEISKLDQEKILSIEIMTKDKNISILRQGENWVIGKEKYTALAPAISDMLDFLEKPVFMSVISESKNYARYGLDEESSLSVTAAAAGGSQRSFEIGTKPTGQRYTFIKLENDNRVLSARGDLRDIFTTDIDKLRDKKVISFDADEINSIELVTKDRIFTAVRKEKPSEMNGSEETKQETEYIWQDPDEKELDGSLITGILREISTLRCLSYFYDKTKQDFKDPVHTIRLRGKKDYTLQVYNKEEDENDYSVTSSESPNPFKISLWKIDNIIGDFEKLFPDKEIEEQAE